MSAQPADLPTLTSSVRVQRNRRRGTRSDPARTATNAAAAHAIVAAAARGIAQRNGRMVVWNSPTEAVVVEPFDIAWTLPDGTEILIETDDW